MAWTQRCWVLAAVCSAVLVAVSGNVPRPRGVPLSRASLYTPTKDFTCFDGSVTIPFSMVNDDYCDCFDGSDEPGTSACINGVFHCTNAGHRPQNVPSSRVNDGVCDCCDGTDEYSRSGVSCADTCDELGREARAAAQRHAELLKAGAQVRLDLITKGNAKRSDMAQQLAQLEKDKVDAEQMKAEKEALKSELESKENEALRVYREADEIARNKKIEEEKFASEEEAKEIFAKFDSDNDGQLTLAELQTRTAFDKNRDGQIDDDEARYFLAEHDQVDLDTFVSEAWSRVKPFLMIEQGMFKPPIDVAESAQSEAEDMNAGEEEELADEADPEEGETEGDDNEEHHEEEVEETEEAPRAYDAHTQEIVDAATEARKQHTEVERSVREIESNIRNIKESLEKDFGPQQEFATLDGQCLELEDKEYVYKLCLFSKVTQKSKNGGGDIGLGNWGEWAGTEGHRYGVMKYTNGISCWNGPNRSTTVNVNCGLETKILSVSEPYRCEYQMELSTPAACDDTRPADTHGHDEL